MNTLLSRRICYLTGSRADFGLMSSTLNLIQSDTRFSLSLVVTGMHLSDRFGMTVNEITDHGLEIAARIPVDHDNSTGVSMASNIGHMLIGIVHALEVCRPDCLVLLGDRGEMLAGALAAAHLRIPIVHLHGGERSGTIDEPVRHSISKMSNLHLVSTSAARERLIRMGEVANHIHVVGAPGLDGLNDLAIFDREQLCLSVGFDPKQPVALLVYHPILIEQASASQQIRNLLEAVLSTGFQVLALMPNSDVGSDAIRRVLHEESQLSRIVLRTHLKRSEFVSWMSVVDVMIGNSSSGIIESATFGTPVVNVGSRQDFRERNLNVIDVPAFTSEICSALKAALKVGRFPQVNLYGDGRAGARIVNFLADTDWTTFPLAKSNAY